MPAAPPPSACAAPSTGVFTGCYYSGQNFDTFVFARTDPTIRFDWTGTGPQGPVALGPDNYSVRWQGNFQLQAGTYQFAINSDDGAKLYVDGQLIYSNWTPHGAMPVLVSAALGSGVHLIQFEYFQAQGGAVAQLSWGVTQ
ncbi:MAG: PA14 domain-containing protein [Ignavibacteriota bacterium]